MWLDQLIKNCPIWIALLIGLTCDVTVAFNVTTVPLIPFQIWVDWTISSPDVLQLALIDYIEEFTIAKNVSLECNATAAFENENERVEFKFTGIASVTDDFGSMTYALLQQEQRMIFENTIELEAFVQVYYEKAIRPFNGRIEVLMVQLLFAEATDVPWSEDDSMTTSDDSLYSTTWFIFAVALGTAAGSAILVVLAVTLVQARVHRWHARLREWKTHLDRERHLIPTTAGVDGELVASSTMPSSSRADAVEGMDLRAAPMDDRHETSSVDP